MVQKGKTTPEVKAGAGSAVPEVKKPRTKKDKIFNILVMGFPLILIGIVGIIVLISMLFNSC